MTPIWIFPAYPLLLIAPFASNLIDALPDPASAARINSVAIALGAVCIQGTGFLVSLMIYSAFIYRLMTQKLPRETTRPGMVCSMTLERIACQHSSNLVRLRWAEWIHSSRPRPSWQHRHAEDNAQKLFRQSRGGILLETHSRSRRAMDVGTILVVFSRQYRRPLATHASR